MQKSNLIGNTKTIKMTTDMGDYTMSIGFLDKDGCSEKADKEWLTLEQYHTLLGVAKKIMKVKDLSIGDWFFDGGTDNQVKEKCWSIINEKPHLELWVYDV